MNQAILFTSRRGFTLVELLVVITIIGILMSLLLPAVTGVREAARQLQCRNHVRQLAMAVQSHVGSNNGRFPGGGYFHESENVNYHGDSNRGTGSDQTGGWIYNILEQLELPNIRNADFLQRCEIPVPMLYCPSRRQPALYSARVRGCYADGKTYTMPAKCAKTDYACNYGAGAYITGGQLQRDEGQKTGIFFNNSAIHEDDIIDGTATTFMLGEKYLDARNVQEDISGQYSSDDDFYTTGRNHDTYRCYGIGRPFRDYYGVDYRDYFGSAHSQGVNMAMCDGAMSTVRYTIDPNVYYNLSNRADGNLVGAY